MSGGAGAKASAAAAAAAIPAAAKKLVQGVKEIVNCTEAEIYAMLKECGMDPDEAVSRLLAQDTFHEVKSKREKKKEVKEIPDSRPRAANSSSSRGSRIGVDRGGRTGSAQYSSSDYGISRVKPSNKKENGPNSFQTTSIMGPGMAGNNYTRKSTGLSESAFTEHTTQVIGIDDGMVSSSQPVSSYQNNWTGKPGHVSMADIVKKGRPQGKTSSTSFMTSDVPYTSHNGVTSNMPQHIASRLTSTTLPSESNVEFHASQGQVAEDADDGYELDTGVEHYDPHNEWSVAEESTVFETYDPSASYADPSASYAEPSANYADASYADASYADANYADPNASYADANYADPSASYADANYADPSASYAEPATSSTLHADESDLQLDPHVDVIQVPEENVASRTLPSESTIQSGKHEDDFPVDDHSRKTMTSYQPQRHTFEHEEAENVDLEISSASANLQQLRLHNERPAATSAGDNPAVIIPSHLQVTNADCSHLSFGSFGSGISATFSGSYQSKPQQTNFESTSAVEDSTLLDQSDARKHEYYDNDQLQYSSNENVASDAVTDSRNYDMPSASQPEIARNDTLDAAHAVQYNLPSASGYAFSSATQPNTGSYAYPQANQQIQNLAPFSSLMQPYASSLPNSLLAPGVQPLREFDLPFSPLLSTQSMPTKYSTSLSTVSGSAGSTPEVNPGVYASPQQASQTIPSTSMPAGPGLPQHLPMHPYSQPTLPLGHFANMVSYPFLPQSYYLPSAAFQQQYTSNGPFHQSPAALQSAGMKYTLPQYKSSLSMPSLPQSAAVASGYGGFGTSANLPGNFSLNPSSAAASAPMGFDETLNMQYKEGNQYAPQQQTDNSMWAQGAGSRTMSALPSSSFYSFQGQSLPNGYRQGQQPSQFGPMGYMNPYHSQAGASQEVHQSQSQNQSEGNLNGSQGLQSQQSHQLWQHGY